MERIAKIAHGVHRAYCAEMGIETQPEWDQLSEEHKKTILDSVSKIRKREITSPQESHQNFVDRKTADGWKYGKKYNLEDKTNPRLLPYEKLTQRDRVKEAIFFACVSGFIQ